MHGVVKAPVEHSSGPVTNGQSIVLGIPGGERIGSVNEHVGGDLGRAATVAVSTNTSPRRLTRSVIRRSYNNVTIPSRPGRQPAERFGTRFDARPVGQMRRNNRPLTVNGEISRAWHFERFEVELLSSPGGPPHQSANLMFTACGKYTQRRGDRNTLPDQRTCFTGAPTVFIYLFFYLSSGR